MSRDKFVMGNWKMNGTKETVHALLHEISTLHLSSPHAHAVVFPPYVYLEKVAWECRHAMIKWGAQDVSPYENGAYTGEVSAPMLKDMGCEYVLIGHSERREYFGETNEMIAQKFLQAAKAGLRPVLCVGETLEDHRTHNTQQKVLAQLESVLKYPIALKYLPQLIVAYEPIWAIGTGATASAEQAQEMHEYIRDQIAIHYAKIISEETRILYGGSIKADNAKSLFSQQDVDGGLVGGSSLNAGTFLEIIKAAC